MRGIRRKGRRRRKKDPSNRNWNRNNKNTTTQETCNRNQSNYNCSPTKRWIEWTSNWYTRLLPYIRIINRIFIGINREWKRKEKETENIATHVNKVFGFYMKENTHYLIKRWTWINSNTDTNASASRRLIDCIKKDTTIEQV